MHLFFETKDASYSVWTTIFLIHLFIFFVLHTLLKKDILSFTKYISLVEDEK